MRYKNLIFQYTKDFQKVGRNFFEREHRQEARSRETLWIDDKRNLELAKRIGRIGHSDIYLPWEEGFVEFTEEVFSELMDIFAAEEERRGQAKREKFEKTAKKLAFARASDLSDGDTVVFRDRENPNRVGKVSIKDGELSINGEKGIESHPFSFRNIRIVEAGDKPEDYFLDEGLGLSLYQREPNYPANTSMDEMMRKMILGRRA